MLEVNFLGSLEIRLNGVVQEITLPQKTSLLLAYLVLHNQPVSRETLTVELWPVTKKDGQAKENLKAALADLKPLLSTALQTEPSVRFIRTAGFQTDTQRLDNLLKTNTEQSLLDAINLYRGHFLTGVRWRMREIGDEFAAWLEHNSYQYKEKIYGVFAALIIYYARRHQFVEARDILNKWLDLDPLHFDANRLRLALFIIYRPNEVPKLLAQHHNYFPEDKTKWEAALDQQSPQWSLFDNFEPLYLNPNGNAPFTAPLLFHYPLNGREEILNTLASKLMNPSTDTIFTLSGMGGIGKTTLAVNVAHRVRSAFKGGVFWAVMSDPATLSDTIVTWAGLMGQNLSAIRNQSELLFKFQGLCNDRHCLFIFDDLDDLTILHKIIPPTFSGKCLITRWAGGLGHDTPVELLTPDSCLDLLASVLDRKRIDDESDAALLLAKIVEYLPIALRFMANSLRNVPELPLQEFADELRANFAGLELFAKVRSIFERSWQHLDAKHQALLETLGVFGTRPFTAELAAELQELPALSRLPGQIKRATDKRLTDTKLALRHLIGEAWLQLVQSRSFRLHTMIADFIQTKLEQNGRGDVLRRKYIEVCLAYAEKNAEQRERFGVDLGNLQAAIGMAFDAEDWDNYLRLLKILTKTWRVTGEYAIACEHVSQGVEVAKTLGRLRDHAELLVEFGAVRIEQNGYEDATTHLEQANILYEQLYRLSEIDGHSPDDDLKGRAAVLRYHGRIAIEQYHRRKNKAEGEIYLKEAETRFLASYRIYSELKDVEGLAETLFAASSLDFIQREENNLQQVHERTVYIEAELVNSKLSLEQQNLIMIMLLELRATAALYGGRHRDATTFCHEALRLCEAWGEKAHRANIHYVCGEALYHLGKVESEELPRGLEQIEYAIRALEQMGDRLTLARCYQTKKYLHRQSGQKDECRAAHDKALALYLELKVQDEADRLQLYQC